MLHTIKVERYSEAESRLQELIKLSNTADKVQIRSGDLFGREYYEYAFDHDVYLKIRNLIMEGF